MAAIAKLQATKQPPLPLKPMYRFEEYPTVRLVNKIVQNDKTDTRKQDLPFCPDPSDAERLIMTIHKYLSACTDDKLKLNHAKRHERAAETLGLDLQETWEDMVKNATATNDNDFITNTRKFLSSFLPPNAFHIQKQYLAQATKPYPMTCYTAGSRLRTINNISIYLPGSGGQKLFPTSAALKSAFYSIMLPEWQLKFDATGNTTDDDGYPLERLITFMEQQRLHHNAGQDAHRRQQNNQGRRHNNGSFAGNFNRNGNRYQPYDNYQGRRNNQFNRGLSRPYRTPHGHNNQRPNGNGFGSGSPRPSPSRPQNRGGRGFYNNNRNNSRALRSRGPAPSPVRSHSGNREVQNLFGFNGQQPGGPSPSSTPADMYYQENNGEHDSYGSNNVDGFYGDYDTHATNSANQDYGPDQGQDAYDSYHQDDSYGSYNGNDGFLADQYDGFVADPYDPYDTYDQYDQQY